MKKALALVLLILTAWQGKTQSMNGHSSDSDSSSGWIPFELSLNQISLPVLINGRQASARLFDAVGTAVDKDLVTVIGLEPTRKAAGAPPEVGLNIQLGGLLLREAVVSNLFLHTPSSPPFDIRLGDEVFKQCIVDIDFLNHKIAFYRPDGFTPPAGAVVLPLKKEDDDRAVPVTVEGGTEMYYWVYLGDPAPVSIYANFFGPHGMLKDRPNSVRQGGGSRRPPEAIATVRQLQVAGIDFKQIPAVLPDDSVTGPHSAEVGGHIGLNLLARFRVIFDYARDRLYIIPGASSVVRAPFAKDRSGLVMRKTQNDYIVTFVCPGSPAMKAGFHPGDTVTQVNNQPLPALQGIAWQTAAWSSVLLTEAGKTYSFTLKDGTIRELKTAEFF